MDGATTKCALNIPSVWEQRCAHRLTQPAPAAAAAHCRAVGRSAARALKIGPAAPDYRLGREHPSRATHEPGPAGPTARPGRPGSHRVHQHPVSSRRPTNRLDCSRPAGGSAQFWPLLGGAVEAIRRERSERVACSGCILLDRLGAGKGPTEAAAGARTARAPSLRLFSGAGWGDKGTPARTRAPPRTKRTRDSDKQDPPHSCLPAPRARVQSPGRPAGRQLDPEIYRANTAPPAGRDAAAGVSRAAGRRRRRGGGRLHGGAPLRRRRRRVGRGATSAASRSGTGPRSPASRPAGPRCRARRVRRGGGPRRRGRRGGGRRRWARGARGGGGGPGGTAWRCGRKCSRDPDCSDTARRPRLWETGFAARLRCPEWMLHPLSRTWHPCWSEKPSW
jgi:hypothetical protein